MKKMILALLLSAFATNATATATATATVMIDDLVDGFNPTTPLRTKEALTAEGEYFKLMGEKYDRALLPALDTYFDHLFPLTKGQQQGELEDVSKKNGATSSKG